MAMLRSELALRWKAASGAAKAATLGVAGQRAASWRCSATPAAAAGLRSDETARASVETHLWQLVDGAPRAVVWLDAGVLVEPNWLAPRVAAVRTIPTVAVPMHAVPKWEEEEEEEALLVARERSSDDGRDGVPRRRRAAGASTGR